jgi:hypothetical protein
MSSKTSITFTCTAEQLKAGYKKALGITVAVPDSDASLVAGLVNALLDALDAKAADPEATIAESSGFGWTKPPDSWGITIFAKKDVAGSVLGEEVRRLQVLLGIDAGPTDA